jgi:hypothetical protein
MMKYGAGRGAAPGSPARRGEQTIANSYESLALPGGDFLLFESVTSDTPRPEAIINYGELRHAVYTYMVE